MNKYCRHKDDLECHLFYSSRDLPEDWFLVESERSISKEEYRLNEVSSLPNIQHRYVLVYQNDVPVAKAYFQLLSLQKEHLNKSLVKSWQYNLWSTFVAATKPAFIIAGHLFRHDEQFFFYSKHISSFTAYKCYKAAIDEVLKDKCASGVLIKDMPPELVDHFQHHTPEYILLLNDISMEMDVDPDWQSIHDYEKALKHKYAQRFRKIRQPWQSLTIKELSYNEVRDKKETLHALYLQVVTHQQVRLGILNPDFIVNLKGYYKERLKVWAAYENGNIVAFFSGWAKDDAFDMFYIGFDYSRNADLQSYFNILFFSVEQAIAQGKNKLILGRTALEAKARLGCKPKYLSTYLHIPNKVLRTFVNSIQENVKEGEGAWENRHPLKPVAGTEK